jgi:hypothetical protein
MLADLDDAAATLIAAADPLTHLQLQATIADEDRESGIPQIHSRNVLHVYLLT